jgi:hypothetical protein
MKLLNNYFHFIVGCAACFCLFLIGHNAVNEEADKNLAPTLFLAFLTSVPAVMAAIENGEEVENKD